MEKVFLFLLIQKTIPPPPLTAHGDVRAERVARPGVAREFGLRVSGVVEQSSTTCLEHSDEILFLMMMTFSHMLAVAENQVCPCALLPITNHVRRTRNDGEAEEVKEGNDDDVSHGSKRVLRMSPREGHR